MRTLGTRKQRTVAVSEVELRNEIKELRTELNQINKQIDQLNRTFEMIKAGQAAEVSKLWGELAAARAENLETKEASVKADQVKGWARWILKPK